MQHLMKINQPAPSNATLDFELAALRQENASVVNVILDLGIEAFKNLFVTIGNFAAVVHMKNVDKGRKEVSDALSWISQLESRKDKINFVALRDLVVPVPEGLKSDFPAYIATLEQQRVPSFKACNDFLTQFQIYVSTFVGDKATKMSNKSLEGEFKALRKQREANEAKLQSFFTNGNAQRAKLGVLFEGQVNLIPSLKQAVGNWDATIHGGQLKTVNAYLDTLTKTMKLVEEIQNSSSSTTVSKAAWLNLSQGAREAAEEIEAVGKYFVRAEIASVSAGHIAERLVQASK